MKKVILIFFVFFIGVNVLTVFAASRYRKSDFNILKKNILYDGVKRRYAYYLPKKYNIKEKLPLVFSLHGGGVYIEDLTGEKGHKSPYKLWMSLADSERFIVVYPEGKNGAYGRPTWNDGRANSLVSSNTDDVGFIATLIDKFNDDYNIDLNRVYAVGTSNGGLMALRLAVEIPDKIAAVAAIGAAMPDVSECGQPKYPISILFMNGTKDNHLPYNGGIISHPPKPKHGTVYSTEESVRIWKSVNQTDKKPIVEFMPNINKFDRSKVIKYSYKNGIRNTEVVLYKIIGGGHSAPSIKEKFSRLFELYFGKQNHDIEMVEEVWNFFKDKKLNPDFALERG